MKIIVAITSPNLYYIKIFLDLIVLKIIGK